MKKFLKNNKILSIHLDKLFITLISIAFTYNYYINWISSDGIPGWVSWADQQWYYKSVQALLRFDFSSENHLYPLGYQILAILPVGIFGYHGYGFLNLILFIIINISFYQILKNYVTPIYSALSISIIFLYDSQILYVFTTPWTNIASLALFSIIAYIFINRELTRNNTIFIGLLGGALFFCRPGDILTVIPIYIYILIKLIKEKRHFDLFPFILSCLVLPIIFLLLNIYIYGGVVSHYMRFNNKFLFLVNGINEKIFSLFFNARASFFTDDKMLFERFPWLIFYPLGIIFLFIEKNWKLIIIQIACLISFVFTVSYAPVIPTTLKLFDGIRVFLPFLFIASLPCFIFIYRLCCIKNKNWYIYTVLLLIIIGLGFLNGFGIKQIPIPHQTISTISDKFLHYQINSLDGNDFIYKQIILPNIKADILSAADSDKTIRIEDDKGCLSVQATHWGLSRSYGVALPLVAPRKTSMINISVAPNLISNTGIIEFPDIGRTEFCIICDEILKLNNQNKSLIKNELNGLVIDMGGIRPEINLGIGWWSAAEKNHTWTTGKQAELLLPPTNNEDIYVELVANSFGEQSIIAELNGNLISKFILKGNDYSTINFKIPGILFNNTKSNLLVFKTPDAISPASIGLNSDSRILGLAVKKIEFNKFKQVKNIENFVINFSKNIPNEYTKNGWWSSAESTHTWTVGRFASLNLPALLGNKLVQINANTLFGSEQKVTVFINDTNIASFIATGDSFKDYMFIIPNDITIDKNSNVLSFEFPNATSPAMLDSSSTDNRILGLAVNHISFSTIRSDSTYNLTMLNNRNFLEPKKLDQNTIHLNIPLNFNSYLINVVTDLTTDEPGSFINVKSSNGKKLFTWKYSCKGIGSRTAKFIAKEIDNEYNNDLLLEYSKGLKIISVSFQNY